MGPLSFVVILDGNGIVAASHSGVFMEIGIRLAGYITAWLVLLSGIIAPHPFVVLVAGIICLGDRSLWNLCIWVKVGVSITFTLVVPITLIRTRILTNIFLQVLQWILESNLFYFLANLLIFSQKLSVPFLFFSLPYP